MLRVSDCVAHRVRFAIPQPTEWENIRNQINAASMPARADFVNVDDLDSFDIPLIESFEQPTISMNRTWPISSLKSELESDGMGCANLWAQQGLNERN